MHKILIEPTVLTISLIALSGVFMHVSQLDNVAVLASTKPDDTYSEHAASKMNEAPKDTHIDMISFSGDTFSLRSQPPAARPREDDESDQKNNRQFKNDGSGDLYSQSTT